jgi:glycosyltransferase involved in cell wall biosynthesis
LVEQRASHHAGASGYHRLAEFLGPEAGARVVRHGFPARGTWRLVGPLVRRAGMAWYGPGACLTELWAAAAAAWQSAILHFLEGENGYRYAAAMPGGKRRRVLATLHLPPSVFAEYVAATRHIEQLDAVVLVARSQLPLLDHLGRRPAVHVVPHGIDVEFYTPPPTRPAEGACLFVGQWLRDFAMLERVIGLVHHALPSIRFRLVLPRERVGEWSGRSGVQAETSLDDLALRRAYQEASLLVMPLKDCTANNAILEAMACGLPLVATDVGGVRDYVGEGCARLTPVGAPRVMAEAIVELLRAPDAREAMGQAARQRAEAFAWPRVASQMAAVYRSLA